MSSISSPAPDTAIGVLIPTAPASDTPATTVEGTAVPNTNWLLNWLGQTELSADGEAAAAAPSSTNQVQWLSLLPSVPSYYNLFAPVAETPDGEAGELEQVLEETLPVDQNTPKDVPALTPDPPSLNPLAVPTSVMDNSAVQAIPTAAVAAPIAQIPQSAQTPDESKGLARSLPSKGVAAVTVLADNIPAPPPLVPGRDKGEVIWSAELVVRDQTSKQTNPAESQVATGSNEPAEPVKVENAPEATALDKPVDAATTGMPKAAAGPESNQRDSGNAASQNRQNANDQSKQTEPVKREERQAPVEAPAPPVHPSAVRAAITAENAHSAVAAEPADSTLAVGTVDLEAAKPLRPTQIATLYIDVPQPGAEGAASPMRLAVTQRGDQVNVQLRSWDSGVSPIDNERMQPLLQSLAEQGISGSKHPLDRMDEHGTNPVDNVHEKTLAAAESANTSNDNNPFQNTEERQQKNQERQQQQALFLRRQLRTVQTAEFDSQSVLGATPNSL